MPMVVPIRAGTQSPQPAPMNPPPEVFTMMAAVQMHSEGRLLVQPTTKEQPSGPTPRP